MSLLSPNLTLFSSILRITHPHRLHTLYGYCWGLTQNFLAISILVIGRLEILGRHTLEVVPPLQLLTLPREEVALELLDFLIGWVFGLTVIILEDLSIARKRRLVISIGGARMKSRATLILYN